MARGDRDPYTGVAITGHEWNGIKELTTPVPRPVWIFLLLSAVFSVLMWVLYPAWPLGRDFTRGVLGVDQTTTLEEALALTSARRATWERKIDAGRFDDLLQDAGVTEIVRRHGGRLFADNCAACHGAGAEGAAGFPNLVDDQWLWGGDPEAIMETLRVGVNSEHDETRVGQMIAYGDLGILDLAQRRAVVRYVMSLSGAPRAHAGADDDPAAGRALFAEHCASCHGDDARGSIQFGAPNLTDAYWIYGGDAATIHQTVKSGRAGVMPNWDRRLSETDRKVLTLYLLQARDL